MVDFKLTSARTLSDKEMEIVLAGPIGARFANTVIHIAPPGIFVRVNESLPGVDYTLRVSPCDASVFNMPHERVDINIFGNPEMKTTPCAITVPKRKISLYTDVPQWLEETDAKIHISTPHGCVKAHATATGVVRVPSEDHDVLIPEGAPCAVESWLAEQSTYVLT